MNNRLRLFLSLFAWMAILPPAKAKVPPPKPNFILILADNLGYGDIEPFGSKLHRTPNLNRMAREGRKLTSFYSASGVCTPSRAALMTGCYPRRVGLDWTPEDGHVLRPVSANGLHPSEITIAEVLKSAGYATACIGKWHLGDQLAFLPTRQGFDYYLGVPYSDDMTYATGQRIGDRLRGKQWPPLPLMENEKVIVAPVDRNTLTRRETEAAIRFIAENKKKPFFLYLPQAMPGSTRAPFASEAFRGKSKNGPWGDSIEELDWALGEILKTLKKHGLDEKTLVLWTSVNGAPRRNPPQGSNSPLGGWGYTTAEGGMRIPAIIRWPSVIPTGSTCDELSSLMDLLPTFTYLAQAELPARHIDGKNIWPLWNETKRQSPHEYFFYYHTRHLQAIRDTRWKLVISDKKPGSKHQLYDLKADAAEKYNLASQNPEVVNRLIEAANMARKDLGDGDQRGVNTRSSGRVKNPTPRKK